MLKELFPFSMLNISLATAFAKLKLLTKLFLFSKLDIGSVHMLGQRATFLGGASELMRRLGQAFLGWGLGGIRAPSPCSTSPCPAAPAHPSPGRSEKAQQDSQTARDSRRANLKSVESAAPSRGLRPSSKSPQRPVLSFVFCKHFGMICCKHFGMILPQRLGPSSVSCVHLE